MVKRSSDLSVYKLMSLAQHSQFQARREEEEIEKQKARKKARPKLVPMNSTIHPNDLKIKLKGVLQNLEKGNTVRISIENQTPGENRVGMLETEDALQNSVCVSFFFFFGRLLNTTASERIQKSVIVLFAVVTDLTPPLANEKV